MPTKIPGLDIHDAKEYLVVEFSHLSDEIKSEIRSRLASICNGEDLSLTNDGDYTYKNTLKEFLIRFYKMAESTQTGMLGELVIHLLTGILYPGYRTIVPFFNLEDRNIKKGFDSIIYSAQIGMWLYEVKSSKPGNQSHDPNRETERLIQIAHKDLSDKLAIEDERARLWRSAMNGMQVSCGHLKDEKEKLKALILDRQRQARTPQGGPEKQNVILSSVLMGNTVPKITPGTIAKRHKEYKTAYNKLIILSVHKSVKIELARFLAEEAK